MSPDRHISLGRPQAAEHITTEGPPYIFRLRVGQLVVPSGTIVEYKGTPHEIAMAAIQGFDGQTGKVSTHREPIHPGVTEMYFPLSGLVLAHMELPRRPGRDIRGLPGQLGTFFLEGQFHHTIVDKADFGLVQHPDLGFLLEMRAGDMTRTVEPTVVILPGRLHGTMAFRHDFGVEPRFFAMKLREIIEE